MANGVIRYGPWISAGGEAPEPPIFDRTSTPVNCQQYSSSRWVWMVGYMQSAAAGGSLLYDNGMKGEPDVNGDVFMVSPGVAAFAEDAVSGLEVDFSYQATKQFNIIFTLQGSVVATQSGVSCSASAAYFDDVLPPGSTSSITGGSYLANNSGIGSANASYNTQLTLGLPPSVNPALVNFRVVQVSIGQGAPISHTHSMDITAHVLLV